VRSMKKLLLVIDYQNDFVSGSLGFEQAVSLEAPICDKIEAYLKNGDDVIFTLDTHDQNYGSTQEGKKLPVPHCLKGTHGWQVYGKAEKYLSEAAAVFEKPTFGSLALAEYLKDHPYDSIELCGVVSNICVISNAVLARAALPEAAIVVDSRCTASGDAALNQKALDVMAGLQVTVL